MMSTHAVNRSIQSQAALYLSDEIEGLITQLPPELVESCLFWTDLPGKENTRLVCRSWNTLTLTASKNPEQPDLNEFIRLLMKNLRKSHPRKMGQLSVIKTMLVNARALSCCTCSKSSGYSYSQKGVL